MDNCNKLIVCLTIIYIVLDQQLARQFIDGKLLIQASAQVSDEDPFIQSQAELEEAAKKPNELDFDENWVHNGPSQEIADQNFWFDFQAQIFLAELLNLIKSILIDFRPNVEVEKSPLTGDCVQFNRTVEKSFDGMKKSIQTTSQDRARRLLPGKAEKNFNDEQRKEAFRSLYHSVDSYFNCLISIQEMNEHELKKSLTPLRVFMVKLAEGFELSMNEQSLQFSKLVPVNTDIILDSIKYDLEKRNELQSNNLIDRLIYSFRDSNFEAKNLIRNLKNSLNL